MSEFKFTANLAFNAFRCSNIKEAFKRCHLFMKSSDDSPLSDPTWRLLHHDQSSELRRTRGQEDSSQKLRVRYKLGVSAVNAMCERIQSRLLYSEFVSYIRRLTLHLLRSLRLLTNCFAPAF
ncbi:hypothetical protein KC19_9G146500 [Ceratodon purpureus]|uniref:Uncharacterized protein n=1 Tax=Ceratodon purpureus TaxID=3225 RepID=A0A8T0GS00_CERPU|nr:hypothetical protein KC19_9G146500 [Ceratodon purpureus]